MNILFTHSREENDDVQCNELCVFVKPTHLHFPLLLLHVNGRLMALLLLQMFPPTPGKSKFSFAWSEMLLL